MRKNASAPCDQKESEEKENARSIVFAFGRDESILTG